ncbi:hypothetical protein Glove_114g11 [Diversispora epigaea]|uniref:Protein kinase domain-containing protein n=1 Tax=Diversispora epigaea TaxID=1348612 RepID=A0A397JAN1_9GLOM|nr:hypothetical protein Glove_114g11 [Diversispora epigaea]
MLQVLKKKKWSPQQFIKFFEKKKDKLFLKPEYIEIIKYQDIAGQDFLMLTEEKLMQYGLKGGPATRIVQFVKEIKGEEQALQLELEKEKRKRAERSKRLRAETETQMSRFQAQTAHLEVSLNPTTHNLAKTYNLMNPQHRQALWFEPAETLTFYQPPTNNTETDYQKYFTKIPSRLDDGSVKAVDSQFMFLDGKASKIATYTKGYSLTSNTVGEIKCQGSCFTNKNLGQVLQYAIIVMNHQRGREQVTGFLTDCHHITFIQVTREEDYVLYNLEYSDQMNLSDSNTTRYLRALLSVIQFHPMTAFESRSGFRACRFVYECDAITTTCSYIVPKSVSYLTEIVDKLRLYHKIGIVHGDVRMPNILVDKDCQLILADFGCGSIVREKWNGCGPNLPFRSLRLMKSKPPILIQPQDDLFMLVQSIYLHLY